MGIAPPNRTPIFYRVSVSLLTRANRIQVLGSDSTGEVEVVLIRALDRLLVGLGSDHTDRKVEAISVALSKQMCPKLLAQEVWDFSSVEPHWDDLILRSYAMVGGQRTIYQEGSIAAILHPRDLIQRYATASARTFSADMAMFCGTLPVIGGLRSGAEFVMELEDPILNRTITDSYSIQELPVES